MGQITTYFRVFMTFARNSLVRDMTFRGNFIIDSISSLAWVVPEAILYLQVFRFTQFHRRGLGAVPVLCLLRHRPGHELLGADVFHDEHR